jgi:hypothetical protein
MRMDYHAIDSDTIVVIDQHHAIMTSNCGVVAQSGVEFDCALRLSAPAQHRYLSQRHHLPSIPCCPHGCGTIVHRVQFSHLPIASLINVFLDGAVCWEQCTYRHAYLLPSG